ncbi:MAG: iron-containing alcohol dehydrogenase [Candidatus Acidiferrales bacterium]
MYTPPMEAPNFEFNMSRLERVIAGPGKVSDLGAELERRGLHRAIVVTGKTLGSSPLLEKVTSAIGARCVGVFRGAKQHVPWSSVHQLRAEIERLHADSLISFGGGSPIDTCKVASYAFLPSRELVHIAVPTTLSAGEYTHAGGVTDETTLVKSGVSDPRLQARTIFNDPELTLETPNRLWVATGMRSLDHAIECIYAIRHHLLSDTLASKAISLLLEHLSPSINDNRVEQIPHRGYCQMAAWFSIFGSMNTRFGISHLLGHQIGPRWNVPHGITSCITLPHAMRFMAGIAPERFGPIAAGFDLPFEPTKAKAAALACADSAANFIAQFDVPHTLKDAGVPRNELHEIVGPVAHELERSGTIDRPVTEREIQSLLEASY